MRKRVDKQRVQELLSALGRRVRDEHVVYLVGGASAVIEGWRVSTLDIDLRPEPDSDELLRALSALKEELDINIEPASPLDFLPALDGWRDRSPSIGRFGVLSVRHMDFRLQALAKLERASGQDLADVNAMLARGVVTVDGLRSALVEIHDQLLRFPAVDRATFTARATAFLDAAEVGGARD